jgi:hypothetical protein
MDKVGLASMASKFPKQSIIISIIFLCIILKFNRNGVKIIKQFCDTFTTYPLLLKKQKEKRKTKKVFLFFLPLPKEEVVEGIGKKR